MKIKFNSLRMSSMRTGEAYAFLTIVLPYLKVFPTMNSKLKQAIEGLAQTMVAMEAAQRTGSQAELTKQVTEADVQRDRKLTRFDLYIQSCRLSTHPKEVEAATLIYRELKTRGSIGDLGLKEETAALHELNTLLTTNPRYDEALQTLHATDKWFEVWSEQGRFEQQYGYRHGVLMEEKPEAAMYELIKKASRLFSYIMELVEDCYHVTEQTEYLQMIQKINPEIDKVMPVLKTRATVAKKKKDEEKF